MKSLNYSQIKRIDPTHTLTLRRSFETALNKRFRLLKSIIKSKIAQNSTDSNEIVNKQVFSVIFGAENTLQTEHIIQLSWMSKYILYAYKKGIIRGRKELRDNGYNVPKIGNDSLLVVLNLPIYANKIELINTCVFGLLFDTVNDVSVYVQSIFSQSDVENITQNEINAYIDEIGTKKIKILMKSEIIKTYYLAVIQEYQNWGITDSCLFDKIEEERNNIGF